jgi:hypothetical protein
MSEMIERMARSMAPSAFETYDCGYTNRNAFENRAFLNAEKTVKKARRDAFRALAAMHEPTVSMLANALPTAHEITEADKKLGAAACLQLTGALNIPNEGDAVVCAAQLACDWRAMISAALRPDPKEGE